MEISPPSPRRLPTLPKSKSRPLSRPLPPVPGPILCKCGTLVTSCNALLPATAIPSDSCRRTFRGFSGKASLFTETYNVIILAPKVQLMQTGAHLLAELNCVNCSQYLGYKIVRAFEQSEKWKESVFLLELAELKNLPPCADSSDSEDSS
ncbi:Yippee domain-containing protein [Mycena indigotica]|uniref:Yippee domain-containing protein n=1 Tax=Mycena indigotica TaxID=2126181 RepID=A0A8H6TDE2_9AGAR|nr:Yippee domain-containing protein [Mycena indigotica]KAF7315638.1 Yippee domain-containing protein [Mycena indigotica]